MSKQIFGWTIVPPDSLARVYGCEDLIKVFSTTEKGAWYLASRLYRNEDIEDGRLGLINLGFKAKEVRILLEVVHPD